MRRPTVRVIARALFAAAPLGLVLAVVPVRAERQATTTAITRPVVSETASPIETIAPGARDGHRGLALLRKPPGKGPFPAVIVIHGGLATVPRQQLETITAGPMASRFLAAGYVVAVMTYRSRDHDPQSEVSLADSIAVVEYLRQLPDVDPKSIVIYGCSGGGDLALQTAMSTELAAIAPEEPATVLTTGVFHKDVPKKGERHTPADVGPIMADGPRYFTPEFQTITRERISRLRSPILILQGDEKNLETQFNTTVFVPALRSAAKPFQLISYPGEPHCFAFAAVSLRPAVALKAFHDTDAFFRRHIATQPRAVSANLITNVPTGLSFVITSSDPKPTAFAGRWQTDFAGGQDLVAELVSSGGGLTGSIKNVAPGQSAAVAIYDGRIDGRTVSFKAKSPTGDRVVTITGTIDRDVISFVREVEVPPGAPEGGRGFYGALGARTFGARRVE